MEKRFCPDCGSENVEPDFRRTNVIGEMMFNTNKWLCNECSYTGFMPSGEASEEMDFKETSGNNELVDGDAGKAYLDYMIYIFLPATFIYVLYLLFFSP